MTTDTPVTPVPDKQGDTTPTLDNEEIPQEEKNILSTLKAIVPQRECIELRGQKKDKYWMSGFFDKEHLKELAHAAYVTEKSIPTSGLYVTLNTTNPALLSRRSNKFETGRIEKNTLTKDEDITNWDYLPIDVDPVRPSGISSTDAELELAYKKACEVIEYLTSLGFPLPLVACSGNGYHLLYRIDLPRSPENDLVVKTILYALDKKFSNDKTGVDIVNHNASRIFKLYGTWAKKGDSTIERPHRLSVIKQIPKPFLCVDKTVLNLFCSQYPLSDADMGGKKKKEKVQRKDPKDVTSRHPEFLKIVGKMVNAGSCDDAIITDCRNTNAGLPEPKGEEDFIKDVTGCIAYCREKSAEEAKLPSYIHQIWDDETGELKGNFIDDIKYSQFLADKFGTIYFKGNMKLYVYDERDHIYVPSANEIETHIRNTIIEYNIHTKLTQIIPELLKHLTSMGNEKDYPFNYSPNTLPVLNGIVKIDRSKVTTEPDYDKLSYIPTNFDYTIPIPKKKKNFSKCISLLPHGKEHKFTYKINCSYNPTANTDAVRKIFGQWLSEKKDITKMFQAPAQALIQMQTRHAFKKAYLIQGETNSGKTSYFKLLIKLFSPEFISSASLQDLCEDRFVGSELEGKILNIRDDLKAIPLKSCEQFKEITGDCSIGVERKYETKYRGWATAAMMFSCNYPPQCNADVKKDSAFWGRFEYVKFPHSFATNPNFYDETYTPEFMSAMFNIILENMLLIDLNNGLLEVSEPGEVLLNWSADSDPIQMFVADTFSELETLTHDYSKQKLHAEYLRWYQKDVCLDEKRMIKNIADFTTALQGYFDLAEHRFPKNEHGKRESIRVYRGKYITRSKDLDLEPENPQAKMLVETSA